MDKQKLKKSLRMTIFGFISNAGMFLGIFLLIAIVNVFDLGALLGKLNNNILGVFFSDIIGSVSAGMPIMSYILAGEIGELSTHMIMITAFLLAWVTVGVVQLPVEIKYFGKKYALIKNLLNFIIAFLGGYLIYFIMIMV